MKCERCSKPVTHHITDIDKNGDWQEHHLCHDHAQTFLEESTEAEEKPKKDVSELAKAFINQSSKAGAAAEAATVIASEGLGARAAEKNIADASAETGACVIRRGRRVQSNVVSRRGNE